MLADGKGHMADMAQYSVRSTQLASRTSTLSDVAPSIVLPSSLFQAAQNTRAMQPTSEPLHAFARNTLYSIERESGDLVI
jgi:hypothetical protein